MSTYRSVLGGPSTSQSLTTTLGWSCESAHRRWNPRFWSAPGARCLYFIATLFSPLLFFHMPKKKCPHFWLPEQLTTVIIREIKCLSQRRNRSLEMPVSLRTKKKMLLAVHLSYRMNVLITRGFSQLRTTPGRGSQKILRVWKEASWLITEHSTPKSLSPPSIEVTLGKPCDLSIFFVISLPSSPCSLPLERLPWFLLQVSNFCKMSFCEAFPDLPEAKSASSLLTHPHSRLSVPR